MPPLILGVDPVSGDGMGKRDLIRQIGALEDIHCSNCSFIKTFKETKRINDCITKCEVGKQIRDLGTQLENGNKKEIIFRSENAEKITKEMYLEFKEQDHSDKSIYKHFNICSATFYRLKRSWGMVGKTNS